MKNKNPNILFIIDDQHRFDWLGCAGASWIYTPNLDSMAEQGMSFSNCFTNSPVCAPARCSLASGLLPTNTGCLSNHSHPLPADIPNIYRHFRENNYRVSLVGRHDLAKKGAPASIYGNRPLNFTYGFTEAFEVEGGMAVSALTEPNGPYGKYLQEQGWWDEYRTDFRKRAKNRWILGQSHDSVLPMEHHQDVFVARKAIERIEHIEDDYPWFMFVSFQGPHDPFDPPKEFGDIYRRKQIPAPLPNELSGKPKRVYDHMLKRATGNEPETQITEARRQYAAKITLIDDQIGQIIKALEKRGCAENTIIIFCSDHGEMAGDMGLWIKHTMYEPSWHVPLIMKGPGIPAGKTSDALIELSDLNPTITELAGLPKQSVLDAKSFAPVVTEKSVSHREYVVSTEQCESMGYYQAIRNRTHKLIQTKNDTTELYDLTQDPDEMNNCAEENPELVSKLTSLLEKRLGKL